MLMFGVAAGPVRNKTELQRFCEAILSGYSDYTTWRYEGSRMTVWIFVDTSKQVGDKDDLKVFATSDAADEWFAEHDPEGVTFEYPMEE